MNAVDRQKLVDEPESGTNADPHPKVAVGDEPKGRIEAAESIQDPATPEDGRLREEPHATDPVQVERGVHQDHAPARSVVDAQSVAEHHVRGRIRCECIDHGRNRPGKVEVVAVEVGDDLAAGSGEPLVDRVVHPAIGLRQPAEPRRSGVAPEDLERAVGGAAVNHDVLDIWVRLLLHRQDRLFDEASLPEARRDDRDEREGRSRSRRRHLTLPTTIRQSPRPSRSTNRRRGASATRTIGCGCQSRLGRTYSVAWLRCRAASRDIASQNGGLIVETRSTWNPACSSSLRA